MEMGCELFLCLLYKLIWGLGYLDISMVKWKIFKPSHLIGWQQSHQPIRSHVRKSLLSNKKFNMDFT